MVLSAIVAVSQNDVIGRDGKLPWSLPAELARFKQVTMGHPVIMGRKTYESIGRALPGRKNIVVTHNPNYQADGCEVVGSLPAALATAAGADEAFIIGGSHLFDEAMPKLDKLYLTHVKANMPGDTFFKFNQAGWQLLESEAHKADKHNKYDFEFQLWGRPD